MTKDYFHNFKVANVQMQKKWQTCPAPLNSIPSCQSGPKALPSSPEAPL